MERKARLLRPCRSIESLLLLLPSPPSSSSMDRSRSSQSEISRISSEVRCSILA
uniref:Putative disease resistance RPP13-like protein 1 n=1 Tax=Rhizophora mucronata TaxID=61149 RepID=A0A2P2PVM7_RHIMU